MNILQHWGELLATACHSEAYKTIPEKPLSACLAQHVVILVELSVCQTIEHEATLPEALPTCEAMQHAAAIAEFCQCA